MWDGESPYLVLAKEALDLISNICTGHECGFQLSGKYFYYLSYWVKGTNQVSFQKLRFRWSLFDNASQVQSQPIGRENFRVFPFSIVLRSRMRKNVCGSIFTSREFHHASWYVYRTRANWFSMLAILWTTQQLLLNLSRWITNKFLCNLQIKCIRRNALCFLSTPGIAKNIEDLELCYGYLPQLKSLSEQHPRI